MNEWNFFEKDYRVGENIPAAVRIHPLMFCMTIKLQIKICE